MDLKISTQIWDTNCIFNTLHYKTDKRKNKILFEPKFVCT